MERPNRRAKSGVRASGRSPRPGAGLLAVASALLLLAAACKSSSGPPQGTSSGRVDFGSLPAAPSPAPAVASPLRTDGTRMMGPDGKEVRFVGVNVQGFQFSNDQGSSQPDQCGRTWHEPTITAEQLARLGFNTVRVPIAWANLEPQPPEKGSDGSFVHHWGEDFLKAIDDYVASLQKQHIATILDIAQFQWSSAFRGANPQSRNCEGFGMPAWLNPNASQETIADVTCEFMSNKAEPGVPQSPWEGLSDVWKMLGQRYRDQPGVVAADTLNEPFFVQPTCPGLDFAGLFKTVGQAIRDVVPNWLLIFEYRPDKNQAFGLNSPPPFDNEMYEIHVYSPSWDDAQSFMSSGWDQAQQWKMPMLVGEFDGFANASIQGEDWRGMTKDMLDWMKERGISWTLFPAGNKAQAAAGIGRAQPLDQLIQTLQQGF